MNSPEDSHSEHPVSFPSVCNSHSELAEVAVPIEQFELTANTLQAHMKTHGKLILKPLICLTANSHDDLTL